MKQLAEMLCAQEAAHLKQLGIIPTGGKMRCGVCRQTKSLSECADGNMCNECSKDASTPSETIGDNKG